MAFFGKSLIYEGLPEWQFVGFTKGLTHVHLVHVWDRLLDVSRQLGLSSVHMNNYGQGPNWKFRVLRQLFSRLGLSEDYLRVVGKRDIILGHWLPSGRSF